MIGIISINGNNNNSLVWLCLGSAPTLVNKTGTITNNFVWLKMGKWETKYSRETFKVNSPMYSWIFEKKPTPRVVHTKVWRRQASSQGRW